VIREGRCRCNRSYRRRIVRIRGLEKVKSNEMLITEKGLYCLAMNLEKTKVGALVFGIDREVKAKQYIYRTKKQQA